MRTQYPKHKFNTEVGQDALSPNKYCRAYFARKFKPLIEHVPVSCV